MEHTEADIRASLLELGLDLTNNDDFARLCQGLVRAKNELTQQ